MSLLVLSHVFSVIGTIIVCKVIIIKVIISKVIISSVFTSVCNIYDIENVTYIALNSKTTFYSIYFVFLQ